MSKWHKIELNHDQFQKLCFEWSDDDTPCGGNRIKISTYHRFVDIYGVITTGSCIPGRSYVTDEPIKVYKFKDEIEAMAFKLRWS